MKNVAERTKKQHYVPQHYQKDFANLNNRNYYSFVYKEFVNVDRVIFENNLQVVSLTQSFFQIIIILKLQTIL